MLFHEGLLRGDVLHQWIAHTLEEAGVRTWADLRLQDDEIPVDQRYKLVVVVSSARELRLPWDYRQLLGVDPDTQLVADAVRASASIPFFFRPFHLQAARENSRGHGFVVCTDGGMLSDYPIDIFDRANDPRWPTLGIKLSAKKLATHSSWSPDPNAFELAKSLPATMSDAHDRMHVDDPYYSSRTIFVDTTGFSSTDFHLMCPVVVVTAYLGTRNYGFLPASTSTAAPASPAHEPAASQERRSPHPHGRSRRGRSRPATCRSCQPLPRRYRWPSTVLPSPGVRFSRRCPGPDSLCAQVVWPWAGVWSCRCSRRSSVVQTPRRSIRRPCRPSARLNPDSNEVCQAIDVSGSVARRSSCYSPDGRSPPFQWGRAAAAQLTRGQRLRPLLRQMGQSAIRSPVVGSRYSLPLSPALPVKSNRWVRVPAIASKEPAIRGSFQLSSMNLRTEDWSVRVWST